LFLYLSHNFVEQLSSIQYRYQNTKMTTPTTDITPNNWFEKLIGKPETEFSYNLEDVPAKYHSWMGEFQQLSINELKGKCDFANSQSVNNPDGLKLDVYYRTNYGHMELFDTSALQFTAPKNSLFQVASNFNCLEVPKANYDPFNGYFLTNQMSDLTQGPSAAGGAAFGSILRLIEHRRNPINLLVDVPIESWNGKVPYYKNKSVPEFDAGLIKIGLHRNVCANFNRAKNQFAFNPNGSFINQLYTSTCICEDTKPNRLSRILQEAAYEGTYLSAVITQAPMVVLTMIGGDVFNNNHELIIDAMMKMHTKYSPYLAKDCIVKLPIFKPNPTEILEACQKYSDVNIYKV
jgi:hypothetical protein